MQVVMVVTNPFKPDPRVYKEAKSLVKAGHEVYIIAWDREGTYPREETIRGFKVIRVGPKAEYGPLMALKLPFFYLNAFKVILDLKPDVIHTHDFDTAILGFIMKVVRRVKWVYDVHDLYFTFFSMEGGRSIFGRLIQNIDVWVSKKADRILVATQSIGGEYEGLREYYVREGIVPEKITTIWNVPDIREFLAYSRINIKKSRKFTIGFIGAQRTLSNFVTFFKALKSSSLQVKVIFVGVGKDTEKLKNFVNREYPEIEVEFVGHVSYDEIPNYYLICDAIYSCFPMTENVKRGLSVKVFEATIMGIPVIVNSETLNSDYVKRYRCGVCVDVGDVEDIKRKLLVLRYIKPFNVKVIREKWDWKHMEDKLLKVYLQLGGYNDESSLSLTSYR